MLIKPAVVQAVGSFDARFFAYCEDLDLSLRVRRAGFHVLLVPADGSYTMAQELMVEVVRQIGPTLVIPMHYFSPQTLARFIRLIEDSYEPLYTDTATVTLSSFKVPYHKILVLPGS